MTATRRRAVAEEHRARTKPSRRSSIWKARLPTAATNSPRSTRRRNTTSSAPSGSRPNDCSSKTSAARSTSACRRTTTAWPNSAAPSNTLRAALAAKQSELQHASSLLVAATRSASRRRIRCLQQARAPGSAAAVLRRARWPLDARARSSKSNRNTAPPSKPRCNHAIHTILADDLTAARQLLASGLQNPSVAAPESTAMRYRPNVPNRRSVPLGAMAWASAVARVRDARFEPLVRSLLANVRHCR